MLDGLFVNHVTGNIIVAASHPGTRYLAEIVLFPVFFVMVITGTYVADVVDRRRATRGIPVVLALEALPPGAVPGPRPRLVPRAGRRGHRRRIVVGSVGAGAMAVQTVVIRLAGHVFPTNMVTGTMMMLGMETARLASTTDAPDGQSARRGRAGQLARVVVGFAAGAVAAAILTVRLDFWAAAVPAAVIVLIARRERKALA